MRRYKAIKNTYRFAFLIYIFKSLQKTPRNGACYFISSKRCIIYWTNFRHRPKTCLYKNWVWPDSGAQWKRYCALNSTRIGVKNGHNNNITRFARYIFPPGCCHIQIYNTCTASLDSLQYGFSHINFVVHMYYCMQAKGTCVFGT